MARRSGLGKGLSALIPSEATGETGLAPAGGADLAHPAQPLPAAEPLRRGVDGVPWPPPSRRSACSSRSWCASCDDEAETYELIAGERRWRAARRAGLQTIPVLVQVADDVASLEQALVENLHRVDLNALEEAAAYQQLIDEFGLTHEQVATRMGKGRATVTNTLRLLQLPAGAQRALAERDHLGRPRPGPARDAGPGPPGEAGRADRRRGVDGAGRRGTGARRRHRAAGRARARDPSRPQPPVAEPVRPQVRPSRSGRRPPTRKLPEPGVLELEDLLSTYLNTRVKVDIQNRRGRLVVEFATLEDLERIYRAMVGDGGVA